MKHVNDIDSAVVAMFNSSEPVKDNRLESLTNDIARAENELKGLLRDRANERSPRQLSMLTTLIQELESKLDTLEAQQRELQKTQPSIHEQAAHAVSLAELQAQDLEEFWSWPPLEINRLLSSLFGKKRFIVKDRQIIDFK